MHRLRNLRSKAPETQWPEIAIRARACYEAASAALATLLRDDFVRAYERELPALVTCFLEDFDACIAHLRFPLHHRKADRWRGLTIGEFEQRQLRAIRDELRRAHVDRVAAAVTPKSATPVRKLRADR